MGNGKVLNLFELNMIFVIMYMNYLLVFMYKVNV